MRNHLLELLSQLDVVGGERFDFAGLERVTDKGAGPINPLSDHDLKFYVLLELVIVQLDGVCRSGMTWVH